MPRQNKVTGKVTVSQAIDRPGGSVLLNSNYIFKSQGDLVM